MRGTQDVKSTVRQLAALVGGEVVGDGEVEIHSAASLSTAGPGQITFLEDEKHSRQLDSCSASALVAKAGFSHNRLPVIAARDPFSAFLTIYQHYHGRPALPVHGVEPRADVHPSVRLGSDVSVHSFVSIGEGTVVGARCRLYPGVTVGRDCVLGDDVTLFPHVVVYDGCKLGNRVTIHANSVIGADGFGYRQQGGRHVKVPQLGGVEIGDDVEIGACSAVDGGTFSATRIGAGTKIDNLVQVAHNCRIGRHNLIVALCGIGGSTVTGDYVVLAGQAGLADHITIGDGVMIGAQAGVINDVPAGQRFVGTPARPERQAKLTVLNAERVGELRKDVKEIKAKLGLNGTHATEGCR
jgi:UDP-3-O-[3-hydroxymyristoyl] glucosamine N-acyltransferase